MRTFLHLGQPQHLQLPGEAALTCTWHAVAVHMPCCWWAEQIRGGQHSDKDHASTLKTLNAGAGDAFAHPATVFPPARH